VLWKNGSTSDYDALQLQFRRRLAHGVQAMASYTWSHSIDENSFNYDSTSQLFRSSSDFDVRHNFQAAATYDIPVKYENRLAGAVLRHWSLDTRVTGRSALPLDVSGGSFVDTTTGITQQLRANVVPGQSL